MTDYRGEPLGEVLQRYTDSSLAAEQLADALSKARPVTEHPAYKEMPDGEQGPAAAARSLAEFVTGLEYRGIEYPVEAYRIFSFLTRVAGEMRTALTLLGTSVEGIRDEELLRDETLDEAIQGYTGASVQGRGTRGSAGQGVLRRRAPRIQEGAQRTGAGSARMSLSVRRVRVRLRTRWVKAGAGWWPRPWPCCPAVRGCRP
ncbi:hypothetical protein [Streptomyces mirabilis]